MTETATTQSKSTALLTACPQCGHFVRLPVIVSLAVHVRCPLCQHRYALRSVLPDEIPGLEVMSPSAAEDAEGFATRREGDGYRSDTKDRPIPVADRLSFPEILQAGAKRRSHRRSSDDTTDPGDPGNVRDDADAVSDNSEAPRPRPRSSRSRRTSSAANPVVEVVKIVLGAVLALPVAQLIIWWGLGLDPFRLGPAVSRVVPIVVPSRLSDDGSASSRN